MTWRLLADVLVLLHLGFTAFVVFGGFFAWRWRHAVLAHLPALIWGLWIEVSGSICPLTPLENAMRARAGEQGYTGGFIEHHVVAVLYPPALTPQVQWTLAGILLGINAVAYSVPIVRLLKARTGPAP